MELHVELELHLFVSSIENMVDKFVSGVGIADTMNKVHDLLAD